VHGEEPDHTNWSRTKWDADAFIDCLDYIFVSPQVKVTGAKPIASSRLTLHPGPYPNAVEPSDHLLVTCTCRVSADVEKVPQTSSRHRRELELETEVQEFATDTSRAALEFGPELSSFERLVVHRKAEKLFLSHEQAKSPRRVISVTKPLAYRPPE
jgi:hypothetical protein